MSHPLPPAQGPLSINRAHVGELPAHSEQPAHPVVRPTPAEDPAPLVFFTLAVTLAMLVIAYWGSGKLLDWWESRTLKATEEVKT